MGTQPDSPLSAFDLAKKFETTVWNEKDINGVDEQDITQLINIDGNSWSAFTIRVGVSNLIVFNSSQSKPRCNSVVMHELAHIMLGHELTSASLTEDGHFVPTTYDQDQEDEADWLAGTLLLPRAALLAIRRQQLDDNTASDMYMVSQQMLTWRFRMTGVDYQLQNARRRYAP
ncbi:ImmA/IrrE family metallo-endopeptidase [Ahrensia kielensis]|uniref:ImmA/IrrE family metallo-endopeptidase n=1 Tax=Ahrensia kielensis TaxID=76980 RepID=A0ABU9T6T9_9HYPH